MYGTSAAAGLARRRHIGTPDHKTHAIFDVTAETEHELLLPE
jgi:hypothetical protein